MSGHEFRGDTSDGNHVFRSLQTSKFRESTNGHHQHATRLITYSWIGRCLHIAGILPILINVLILQIDL